MLVFEFMSVRESYCVSLNSGYEDAVVNTTAGYNFAGLYRLSSLEINIPQPKISIKSTDGSFVIKIELVSDKNFLFEFTRHS